MRRGAEVGRADPGARRVELGVGTGHAEGCEQPGVQEAGVGLTRPNGAGDDARDDVRRARRVGEPGARGRGERAVGCEVGHVVLALTEEHLDHVGHAVVLVVLHELESVADRQQLAQRDGMTRIVWVGPFGHSRRRVQVQSAVADEHADDRVQHGLGHRPAEQRRCRGHGRGRAVEMLEHALVALGYDFAAVHDQHAEGRGQRAVVVKHFVEQWAYVDAGRERTLGPGLSRPGDPCRLAGECDQAAHTEARNESSAALVSAGFSCCTQ